MTIELTLLAWTLVVALIQVLVPALLRNRETGIAYNASARDAPGAPVGKLTGRLMRAQSNLFETLPVFAAAVLIAHVAGRDSAQTQLGAWLYLLARIVYVPLYAAGVPYLRSLVWAASLAGILLILSRLI
ncbi:MAPEG family protein [Paraburkholderia rhizosphaerae]|uniref:Putative MAPEG superfamily protein n=1 Tax=Paraburkholderia rhizosphaerae TaxID=480658 RepID=A0A4R8LLJ9_9BURK|nr:MAPEG family protein [Paraburkholderia rhizosphaerae]TDY45418.1 putative MAPEG superfamily protein [Paraburkholderia rhizosphaerae]